MRLTRANMQLKAAQHLPGSDIRIEFHSQTSPNMVQDIKRFVISTFWHRHWSDGLAQEIVKWRYCGLHAGEMVVAYHGQRLVAMVAPRLRPYIIARELVYVREPTDWFCLPDYRCLGLGLRLMSVLMERKEPLLAIGGSSDAISLFRSLGWQQLAEVKNYTLPLTTRFVASKASRLLHLPFLQSIGARFGDAVWPQFHRLRSESQPWQHLAVLHHAPEMRSAASAYDFLPMTDEQELDWLYAAPKHIGTFFCLVFPEKSGAAAFVVCRLYSYDDLNYAKLIHVYTPSPSVQAYTRMLSETISYVQHHKTDAVQCRASSPFLRPALKKAGFIGTGLTPAYWWAKNKSPVHGNFHLTFLRGDDGIRPYPE
jgi:hypothetical protein